MAKKSTTVVKKSSDPQTIEEMTKDLIEYRRSNAAGELVNTRAITALRKQIAQAKTKQRLEQLKSQKETK